MKHCNNCGAELHDDARVCSGCGADQASDTARRAERCRSMLSLVLAIVALCVSVLAFCMTLGLSGGKPDASVDTPLPGDTATPGTIPTAEPTPTEMPTATPDRSEALDKLGVSTKNLTPEIAGAYASLIQAEQHPVVRAAMFDGGGVPMLWLAYGEAAADYGDYEGLDWPYDDHVYAFLDGKVEECPWITTLLREGDKAVVAQMWVDEVSDLQDDFRLYRMKNGRLEETPFASGTAGINGGTLNGQPVGEEEYLTLRDLYQMVDPELDILLNADSGLAALLFLSGSHTWLEGQELADALLVYAG